MLLRHLRYTSNFYPYSSLRPISAQFSAVAKHITATVRKDLVSLEFQLSGERPINFFVSPSFTFKTLKDTILTQYPTADFEYNFSATQKSDIEENSNIYDFLNSKANLEAKIHINEDDFVLKSIGGEPLSQTVFSLINETREDKISTISWYGKSLEKGIPQPHAGTLAYFISNFNAELEKYKGKGKLSEKEIEEAVKKAAVFGKEPVERKLETCYHEINILTSQINVLEHEKLTIEDRAEARINKYLKIILFVTLAQFASFYYMIFHVEWLGKLHLFLLFPLYYYYYNKERMLILNRLGYYRTNHLYSTVLDCCVWAEILHEIWSWKRSWSNQDIE